MQNLSGRFEHAVKEGLLSSPPDLKLTPLMTLGELRLDSLGVMALMTSLECAFKTTLPPNALERGFDTTLGELATHCPEMPKKSASR